MGDGAGERSASAERLGAAAEDGAGERGAVERGAASRTRVAHAPTYVDADGCRTSIARVRLLAPARLLLAHEPPLEGAEVERFLVASAGALDAIRAAVGERVAASDATSSTAERLAAAGDALSAADLLADAVVRLRGDGPPIEPATLAASVVAELTALEAAGLVRRLPGRPVRWTAAP